MRAGDRVTFPYTWSSTYDGNGRDTGVMREHTATVHATVLSVGVDGVTAASDHTIYQRIDSALLTITEPYPEGKTFDPWNYIVTGER